MVDSVNTLILAENAASNIEQVLEAALYKAAAVWPPNTHYENYPS